MARTSSLEAQLSEITKEFVKEIVSTIQNASFAEVAGFAITKNYGRGLDGSPAKTFKDTRARWTDPKPRGRRPRQSAEKRAELGHRVLNALSKTTSPIGVRAIASEVGVAADLLVLPLRELRDAGKIAKHGERRNTTYSMV